MNTTFGPGPWPRAARRRLITEQLCSIEDNVAAFRAAPSGLYRLRNGVSVYALRVFIERIRRTRALPNVQEIAQGGEEPRRARKGDQTAGKAGEMTNDWQMARKSRAGKIRRLPS